MVEVYYYINIQVFRFGWTLVLYSSYSWLPSVGILTIER